MPLGRQLTLIAPERILAVVARDHPWVPKKEDCEAADLFGWRALTMYGAYYDLVALRNDCPTQGTFWNHFRDVNGDFASECSAEEVRAMECRLYRAWNSLVAEHHLMALLVQTGAFNAVQKREALDISSQIDLLVTMLTGEVVAVEIRTATRNADYWVGVKQGRYERRDPPDAGEDRRAILVMPFGKMIKLPAKRMDGTSAMIHLWGPASVDYAVEVICGLEPKARMRPARMSGTNPAQAELPLG